MSAVSQIEKRTWARIIALSNDRLRYDLGNWTDSEGFESKSNRTYEVDGSSLAELAKSS